MRTFRSCVQCNEYTEESFKCGSNINEENLRHKTKYCPSEKGYCRIKTVLLNRVNNDNVLILWLWHSSQSFYKSDLIKVTFYRQHVYICEKRRRKPWLFSMNNWVIKLEVLKKNVGDFFQIFRFNGNCLFFENWIRGQKSFVFLVSTSIFVGTDEICRVWWTCRKFTRLNMTKRLKKLRLTLGESGEEKQIVFWTVLNAAGAAGIPRFSTTRWESRFFHYFWKKIHSHLSLWTPHNSDGTRGSKNAPKYV